MPTNCYANSLLVHAVALLFFNRSTAGVVEQTFSGDTRVGKSHTALKQNTEKLRVVAEKKRAREGSSELWRGLVGYNAKSAGPLKYTRLVLAARDESGRVVGGVILQSYWKETYVELLWLSDRAR